MAELSATELERIIRRAAELQFTGDEGDQGALTEAELFRIAGEVGLERRYVEQAMAEVRTAALRPELPSESSVAARLFGSGFLQVSRFLPGPGSEVEETVERQLELSERLRKVRRDPEGSHWVAAEGWKSAARRSEMSGGHAYELGTARGLAVSVREAGPDRALVTLTADVRNQRTEQLLTWVGGLGVPGLLASGVLVAAGGVWMLLAPVPVLALCAAGVWATGPSFRKERERLRLVMEAFLDRLERARRSRIEGEAPRQHRVPPFF